MLRFAFFDILSVIMFSDAMLSVILLNVIVLSVIMMNVVMFIAESHIIVSSCKLSQ